MEETKRAPAWGSLSNGRREAVASWLRDQIHEMRHEREDILEHSGLDVDWIESLLAHVAPAGDAAPLQAVDGVPGDLCIRVDIRVADDDSNALALLAEARKFVKKMVKTEQIGTQEEQFCVGAIRVTTSRATDEGAGGR